MLSAFVVTAVVAVTGFEWDIVVTDGVTNKETATYRTREGAAFTLKGWKCTVQPGDLTSTAVADMQRLKVVCDYAAKDEAPRASVATLGAYCVRQKKPMGMDVEGLLTGQIVVGITDFATAGGVWTITGKCTQR